ncbi:MAG: hypothetical protein HY399_05185 [Elusimicrobia bacterium]|nr:hypothetical protein [Elusimicrobiota bacterium]
MKKIKNSKLKIINSLGLGLILVVNFAFCTLNFAFSVGVSPLYNAQVLGGQYFFHGDKANLSGNASFLAAPALKFNEEWSLIPNYYGSFQGTKQVLDLVGAGTLFQQVQNHRLGIKAIYDFDDFWRFKSSLGYKIELAKETRDEAWGKGLFDYHKPGGGVEVEYVYEEPFSVRLGLDSYYIFFPNYSSLESQRALDFNGEPLARELVGSHVINTWGNMATLSGSCPLGERAVVEGQYLFNYQKYPSQHLVDASGAFTSTLRNDKTHSGQAAVRLPQKWGASLRGILSFGVGATLVQSNQNNYDARNTLFIAKYYNYQEFKTEPALDLSWEGPQKDRPVGLKLGLAGYYRRYSDRLSQDSTGIYLAEKIHQLTGAINLSLHYPLAPNFGLLFHVQYGNASSNMKFEQFYKYNYTAASYLFGFKYEY